MRAKIQQRRLHNQKRLEMTNPLLKLLKPVLEKVQEKNQELAGSNWLRHKQKLIAIHLSSMIFLMKMFSIEAKRDLIVQNNKKTGNRTY